MKKLPSIAKLKTHFSINGGDLIWKKVNSQRAKIGCRAGFISKTDGYIYVRLENKRFLAHRIVWKMATGKDPKGNIDHINGIKTDNNIKNLRVVNCKQNARNAKIYKNNTSGVCGVSFCKRSNKWLAHIRVDYKKKNLGLYKNLEDAIQARKNAEKEFGFHVNHGRK